MLKEEIQELSDNINGMKDLRTPVVQVIPCTAWDPKLSTELRYVRILKETSYIGKLVSMETIFKTF